MKKSTLLIFSCVLALFFAGCGKDDPTVSFTSEDENLAGETVTAGDPSSPYLKLFILNEGSYGQNNSSLDFFRFRDGKYASSSFKSMNPSIAEGLGDVGNDIQINGSTAWMAVNNSGIVEVIDTRNEKETAAIKVPSPRRITFDDEYAYVSSYSGAYYGGPDRKGAVYRIGLKSMAAEGSIEVGYQPEGLTVYGGCLYVANSGGLKSDHSYDNTISVIDLKTFKVTRTMEVASNLQSLESDGKGNLWATAFGDWSTKHSNLYKVEIASGKVTAMNVRVGTPLDFCEEDGDLHVIGTEDEWNWDPGAVKSYILYSISTPEGTVTRTGFAGTDLNGIALPYGILVNPENGDLYIGDASDSKTPGFLWCFSSSGSLNWKANAGLFPGHLALAPSSDKK